MSRPPLEQFLIGVGDSIRDAMACIDRNAKQIALVVDEERRLHGVVTDGDIRRAILAGVDVAAPVRVVCERTAAMRRAGPVTAPAGTPDAELLHMMNELSLWHIPLVDGQGRVLDIAILTDLVKDYELPLTAVVMAGGYGVRLSPLTAELPKPMLPVGDRPLLERIIDQLRQAGIRRVNLATHYRQQVITDHFGDGSKFGVDIEYLNEDQPLGTAGALRRVQAADEDVLVINGDILTRVDFSAMLRFHRDHAADMTVAVRPWEFRLPYGVVATDGVSVTGISEKPMVRHCINAGIYLLKSEICRVVPDGRPYEMPELIARLVKMKRRVVSFPVHEYWLDIGHPEDYRRALGDVSAEPGREH